MKKGWLLLLLVVGLLLGAALVNTPAVFAQEEVVSVVPDVEEVAGEIVSINTPRLSVVVKYLVAQELPEYQTVTGYFSDTTEIKKGDEGVKFADLKVGDKITLRYTTDDVGMGKNTVVSAAVEIKE